jgi:hypothetical protein
MNDRRLELEFVALLGEEMDIVEDLKGELIEVLD